ncbi:hypothetical protein PAHAL_5G362300 [Panicum hallii]|uniref:Uncharacterized protein n=1 Tax=Panicum hallii TaxID=206008 RepID=A0A2T8IMC1_9POAL|nr:hypothetical protein PAHAL_5G362300 [Panicum hallii]
MLDPGRAVAVSSVKNGHGLVTGCGAGPGSSGSAACSPPPRSPPAPATRAPAASPAAALPSSAAPPPGHRGCGSDSSHRRPSPNCAARLGWPPSIGCQSAGPETAAGRAPAPWHPPHPRPGARASSTNRRARARRASASHACAPERHWPEGRMERGAAGARACVVRRQAATAELAQRQAEAVARL